MRIAIRAIQTVTRGDGCGPVKSYTEGTAFSIVDIRTLLGDPNHSHSEVNALGVTSVRNTTAIVSDETNVPRSTIRELRDQPQCLLTAYPTGPSLSITSPGVRQRVKGIQPLGATGSFLSHPVAGRSCSRLPPKRRLGGVERAMRGDGPTHDGP